MTAIKEKAYAKINLYLDVLGIREDGFHNIKTVMHTVSLADDLIVSVMPSRVLSVTMDVEGNRFVPTDSKNLAYRAAVLFHERLGVHAAVNIRLVKRIPVAGGLAGGSSDAAATLRALNKLYKKPFTANALLDMGAELGSDVPYCIVGKTALCEGRGEKITKIDSAIKMHFVIANAGDHVSTPEAYRALDEKYSFFDGSVPRDGELYFASLMSTLSEGVFKPEALYNIFEEPVLSKCERSSELKRELYLRSAVAAMMSGSGPSVFAVFESEQEAKATADAIRSLGFFAEYATTV